jgi:S-adenosylmethionine-diacylgycerolhomoserine-N-methlytransferase
MSLLGDLKVLYHLAFKPVRGRSHQERLESFYGGQAEAYDQFRKRLLQGRSELYRSIPLPEEGVWVDLGGGTGANLEWIADRVPSLKKVYVVDLAPSLLEVAEKRINEHGWDNVETVQADVTRFTPAEGPADVVTFSYSLTMIPDWFLALEQAEKILKPGGRIGVVDFYVARKYPAEEHEKHKWFTRSFWPVWFASDNVYPSADHLPFLESRFETVQLDEGMSKVPYMPLLRVPHYRFIGRKKGKP